MREGEEGRKLAVISVAFWNLFQKSPFLIISLVFPCFPKQPFSSQFSISFTHLVYSNLSPTTILAAAGRWSNSNSSSRSMRNSTPHHYDGYPELLIGIWKVCQFKIFLQSTNKYHHFDSILDSSSAPPSDQQTTSYQRLLLHFTIREYTSAQSSGLFLHLPTQFLETTFSPIESFVPIPRFTSTSPFIPAHLVPPLLSPPPLPLIHSVSGSNIYLPYFLFLYPPQPPPSINIPPLCLDPHGPLHIKWHFLTSGLLSSYVEW